MAKYVYSLDNSQPMTIEIVTNAAVIDGELVAITSGLAGPLTAADVAILGISMGAYASGATAKVLLLNPMSVIRISYSGTSKTSLAAADKWGTAFDYEATGKTLNLDDTTGGVFRVVNYNNTDDTADVVISAAKLWTV